MKRLSVVFLLCSLLSVPAWGIELTTTIEQEHPAVWPKKSVSMVIFHERGGIPLATVLDNRISTTIQYTVQKVTAHAVVIRAYNHGIFPQRGFVTIGFWE